MTDCRHWSACGIRDGGCCSLLGNRPSAGYCKGCKKRETNTARGLGDTVARVLDVTGVAPVAKRMIERVTGKPCRCEERRRKLNAAVPYRH